MTDYALRFIQVSKKYRIGRTIPTLKTLLNKKAKPTQENYHWAIRDISFELKPGGSLGIIGPNGAGKTTILKLLSWVTQPTSGEIKMNGRFSALIELGAGFHPELTGRENIFLNGAILGMHRSEIQNRFDQIVDFADIEEYLDTPVKRYSSGMYARLGFSVAAHVDPEILLIDEVLAVGDMAFRKKCYERMLELIRKGTTLVFVSHDFGAVQKVCARTIVLYRGHLAFDGYSSEAIAEYSNILRRAASSDHGTDPPGSGALSQMVMTHAAEIQEVKLFNLDGKQSLAFQSGETIRVRMKIKFHQTAKSPVFACTVRQPDGQVVYDYTTQWANQPTPDFQESTLAEVEYMLSLNLAPGIYQLGVDLAYADLTRYYDRMVRALDFVVDGGSGARGIANLNANFGVIDVGGL